MASKGQNTFDWLNEFLVSLYLYLLIALQFQETHQLGWALICVVLFNIFISIAKFIYMLFNTIAEKVREHRKKKALIYAEKRRELI